jgi:putative endonuclease
VRAVRTPDDRRAALARGAEAEDHVATLLTQQGWVVVFRNWRGGGGEIDIVVRRDDALRFVEVKAREPDDLHGPEMAIGPGKQRKLARAAQAFLAGWTEPFEEAAFLVALVEGPRVTLIDDAFDV